MLLSTIRWPKNLLFLTEKLPKPTYNTNGLTDESSDYGSEGESRKNRLPNLSRNQIFSVSRGIMPIRYKYFSKSKHTLDNIFKGKVKFHNSDNW